MEYYWDELNFASFESLRSHFPGPQYIGHNITTRSATPVWEPTTWKCSVDSSYKMKAERPPGDAR